MNKSAKLEVLKEEEVDAEVIRFFLRDEFFESLNDYLTDEDYALAKDALKGLYILALKLRLFNLYECLLDLYEDLEGEYYQDVFSHYEAMMKEHKRLKEVYL